MAALHRRSSNVVDGTPGQRRAAFEACRRGFLLGNYEQLIRDLDIVREWRPDIVVLDEAQRIKNWATKTASPSSAWIHRIASC